MPFLTGHFDKVYFVSGNLVMWHEAFRRETHLMKILILASLTMNLMIGKDQMLVYDKDCHRSIWNIEEYSFCYLEKVFKKNNYVNWLVRCYINLSDRYVDMWDNDVYSSNVNADLSDVMSIYQIIFLSLICQELFSKKWINLM